MLLLPLHQELQAPSLKQLAFPLNKKLRFLKLSIFQEMLWIEGVRGGPLCRVPVQCSQVGHNHGSLEKAGGSCKT